MLEWITSPEAWIALATLTALEIVLGIDNIIFLSILVDRLPEKQRPKARLIGLSMAMVMRLLLLASLAWLTKLTADLFTVLGQGISGRDLVLILGGLFLLAKSVLEIHHSIEDAGEAPQLAKAKAGASFMVILIQIAVLDMVFSLDSVITAVGMANHLEVMVIAVIIAVGFMMVFANAIGRFITEHPTLKMLALSFLVLVGTALIADGLEFHIPKGYIYFAMAFSFGVEMLNLRLRAKRKATAVEP
ncbi:TerC family protein [Alloalcanivorax marinus]|uniref:TerC family protein n=1 Tax=Alloalcanivorax marinus TaxID=1177169 RepID=UPI0019313EF0|nr:TerC family protein [Alloalcanivorax marinus]MBL7251609.1 TerC family protein [Alloalcanivorax marinus]